MVLSHVVSQPWHEALVTANFKKGDVDDHDNYRPICAGGGLQTLCDDIADSTECIWRRDPHLAHAGISRGCADALYVAGRMFEDT